MHRTFPRTPPPEEQTRRNSRAGTSQNTLSSSSPISPAKQDGEAPSSPTLPIVLAPTGSKPRKGPTITPRSFTRFFTPIPITERRMGARGSRKALGDITVSGVNRRCYRTLFKIERRTDIGSATASMSNASTRKRHISPSSLPTPDFSSPAKRACRQSPDTLDDDARDEDFDKTDDDGQESLQCRGSHNESFRQIQGLIPSQCRGTLGQSLRREIGGRVRHLEKSNLDGSCTVSNEYQSETGNFYTEPRDTHWCNNLTSSAATIPFCTASCNTNTLIAVGDEDGGMRLLESAGDQEPALSSPWLTFRPHTNALLDLDFSPDDLRLATASGDQTSKIIDMPTQQTLSTLVGHRSSLKQVRFQPESSNVLVTSSRDGDIRMWDLRCRGLDMPLPDTSFTVDSNAIASGTGLARREIWAQSIKTIMKPHASLSHDHYLSRLCDWDLSPYSKTSPGLDVPSRTEPAGRRGDASVTALAFLPASRSHLLLSGSEAEASVKLWDLRIGYKPRRNNRPSTPVSSTRPPESHIKHRHFGLTSISLSADSARLYTLCRDNTIYAYSVSHLILGSAPELCASATSTTRRQLNGTSGRGKQGLGPLYGFRHPSLHATTFYVKSAVRSAGVDKRELLAVGSGDGCAVIFPTDERYMKRNPSTHDFLSTASSDVANPRHPVSFSRTESGSTFRLDDSIPIYQHGTALIRGHSREVTGLTWTPDGNLVTVGDDSLVRCWREDDRELAREMRLGGESGGRRWGYGWADVVDGWDDDE